MEGSIEKGQLMQDWGLTKPEEQMKVNQRGGEEESKRFQVNLRNRKLARTCHI